MLNGLFSLDGKVALVTGGNSGLGRAIALGLRGAGARVVVIGRDAAKNAAAAADLNEAGAALALDVNDESAVRQGVEHTVERFGRLDILVNNAGTIRVSHIIDQPREDWDAVIETNLTAAYLCAKHAARQMVAQGEGGKIINIGSVGAHFGPPDFASYAVSKAGMIGLTNALAVELAPYNIQVNLIEPGYFETDMSAGVPDWLKTQIIRKTPAGRWGKPEELVGAAVFLASPASSYITGAALRVDGGYTVCDRLRNE